MADEIKKDEAAQAAEDAAVEVAKAGELALDALRKALTYFSPARRMGAAFSRLGRVFSENGFRRLASAMGLLGDGIFVLVEVLVIVIAIAAAIKLRWNFILLGIGILGLFLAIQYIASRFLELNDHYIKQWPTRLGIPALPGTLAWLVSVGGLLFLILKFQLVCAEPRDWQAFWLGVGGWVAANFLAWSLLHPGLANVAVEQDTRGPAEILDVLAYFTKLGLRLISMVFGFSVLGGLIWLIAGMIELFRTDQIDAAQNAVMYLVIVGFLPLLAYVGALIWRHVIGRGEAILSLLGREDLRKR